MVKFGASERKHLEKQLQYYSFRFEEQLLFLRPRGKFTKAIKVRRSHYYSYLSKGQIIN